MSNKNMISLQSGSYNRQFFDDGTSAGITQECEPSHYIDDADPWFNRYQPQFDDTHKIEFNEGLSRADDSHSLLGRGHSVPYSSEIPNHPKSYDYRKIERKHSNYYVIQ